MKFVLDCELMTNRMSASGDWTLANRYLNGSTVALKHFTTIPYGEHLISQRETIRVFLVLDVGVLILIFPIQHSVTASTERSSVDYATEIPGSVTFLAIVKMLSTSSRGVLPIPHSVATPNECG